MTRKEFAVIFGKLQAGCGMKDPPSKQTADVYFDVLRDLSFADCEAAVVAVLMDHIYPTLPPAGAVRKAALGIGKDDTLGVEAFEQFRRAVRQFGRDKQVAGLSALAPRVARAASLFGWQRLCETPDAMIGIAQRDFLSLWETVSERDDKLAALPPAVKQRIAAIGAGIGVALPEKAGQG